jgi:hypothetical protein
MFGVPSVQAQAATVVPGTGGHQITTIATDIEVWGQLPRREPHPRVVGKVDVAATGRRDHFDRFWQRAVLAHQVREGFVTDLAVFDVDV